MSINIAPPASDELRPRITVIGVGGAGGNAIANMIAADIEGVEFVVANTDAQALNNAVADTRIQLGPEITGGLGAGARPEVGKAAAEETVQDLEDLLDGVNMCFIAAGMGGGTGTGAAPVIAEAARRKGVLTVGVVTKPFLFEGTRRMRAADAGIEELQKHVDTLIVIPNQNLFLVAKADTTFKEAFQLADEVLQQGVRSITDLMVMPGLINLDFADVKSVMEEMGKAMMGTGEGEGENRALEAAERAIANPLLDGVSMQGAKGVIISIIGGEDMRLLEVDEAANHIRELVDEDANIIWGSAFNPDLEGKIRVSVVATGIEAGDQVARPAANVRAMSFGESRAPQRPVLDLPAEDELPDEAEDAAGAADEPMSLGGFQAGDESADEPRADLADAASDAEDEAEDDAEAIVDLLAGIRDNAANAAANSAAIHPDNDQLRSGSGWSEDAASSAEATGHDTRGDDGWRSESASRADAFGSAAPRSDDDQAGAGKAATQQESQQRRGFMPGPSEGGVGSTLFERMANLSRNAAAGAAASDAQRNDAAEDDDDDDDISSLSIPRFLGRQNNQ